MVEEILLALEAYIIAMGGSVPYTDFVEQIPGTARVAVVTAARRRFKFYFDYTDPEHPVHSVKLRS